MSAAPALGVGAFGFGSQADPRVDEPPARVEPVQFHPGIEPLVRWIEDTPRERIIEQTVEKVRAGLPYRDMMAGIFLAAIRNVKPRPVGFKFHAVMAVHSAHLLGQTAPVADQVLPMLWALDNFKGAQARDVEEGDWTLERIVESRLPSANQARAAFHEAMDAWDSDKADAATAALCRTAGAAEVMELFYAAGVRDQRNIGHKPIFTMQCWRTLQAIGWEHAEPVLRSLAFGLLDQQGEATNAPAGPYESNVELARTIRDDWTFGRLDPSATQDLLDAMRSATPQGVGRAVVETLNRGVAPGSVWDAVMLAASEFLMCDPGIVALHAMTAANSLHYIHCASGVDATRKLALLQAATWMPLYRQRIRNQSGIRIDLLEPAEPAGSVSDATAEIFSAADSDREKAARLVMGFARSGHSLDTFFQEARRHIFRKGRDSHQYKYGAAIWEECGHAADPRWQAPLAAAAIMYFPSAGASEIPWISQARERLGSA